MLARKCTGPRTIARSRAQHTVAVVFNVQYIQPAIVVGVKPAQTRVPILAIQAKPRLVYNAANLIHKMLYAYNALSVSYVLRCNQTWVPWSKL